MSTLWKPQLYTLKTELSAPAIMRSLDNLDDFDRLYDYNPQSFCYLNKNSKTPCARCNNANNKSFLLLNGEEKLQISNVEEFLEKLNCSENAKVKVVSIFGNTADGKNHIMNHVFFKGKEIFSASNKHNCCTLGVWVAFDPVLNVICLDTEGLQGITSCENENTRLLAKVLAISDIIVYGIHSDRLNKDIFKFLSTASHTYSHYFKTTLQMIDRNKQITNPLSTFGPSVIVLHETRNTKPLMKNELQNTEDILKSKFVQMNLDIDSFSSIKYVGLQTVNNTNYEQLQSAIETEIKNTTIRSARKPHLVYNIIKRLNDQLSSERESFASILFPEQYFTCPAKCLSCNNRCNDNMEHIREGKPHSTNTRCKFQCQFENITYLCKQCYKNGKKIEVSKQYENEDQNSWYSFATNAWSGYILNCSCCGVIYRSKQYWYGNNTEDNVVRKKITHVWNAEPNHSAISQNTAQRVIDSVSYISEAVTNASLRPTKGLKAWAADQVAPSYWRSNSEIIHCYQCKIVFNLADDKHHCRDCGEGFCDQCSSKTKPVPTRNWHSPVRVCDRCYDKETNYSSDDSFEFAEDVGVRKVTEHVVSTLNVVGSVLNYSKSFIKDSVRPSYWIPDSEIVNCNICERKFSVALSLHHCRACGYGVCDECSQHRKPVLHRGWHYPVRICNACI